MSVNIPQHISYHFNAYFVDNVDRMLNLSKVYKQGHVPVNNIIHNPHSMFLVPVTEEDAQKVTSKLKGKYSAAYDEIPEMIIKQCIQFIKKTTNFYIQFTFMFSNLSILNAYCKSTARL
jgi:hypothetical protein